MIMLILTLSNIKSIISSGHFEWLYLILSCMLIYSGLDIENIDYSRYPAEEFQKQWIRMYLEEVACLEGMCDGDCS